MRISRLLIAGVCGGVLFAHADARAQQADTLPAFDSFRQGAEFYNLGEMEQAFRAFEQAAEEGNAVAQWKVGRMYAEGEGTAEDDYKAFQMFSRIADAHADDNPYSPVSRVVANAFVNLGHYYRQGIEGANIKADPRRAVDLYTHAAVYFGDPEAQYALARLYLDGEVQRDSARAVRWLSLAASKNHVSAQATLGDMLVYGHGVRPIPERGYMWLLVARAKASPSQRDQVLELIHRARPTLSDRQQMAGEALAADWLEKHGVETHISSEVAASGSSD